MDKVWTPAPGVWAGGKRIREVSPRWGTARTAALRAWASCCFFPPFLSGSDPSVGWRNHGVTRQGWTTDTAKHTVLLDRKPRAWAALSCLRVWGGSCPPSRHATRSSSVAERQPEATAKTHPVERSSRGKKTTGVKLKCPPPSPRCRWGQWHRTVGHDCGHNSEHISSHGTREGVPWNSESLGKPHKGASRSRRPLTPGRKW